MPDSQRRTYEPLLTGRPFSIMVPSRPRTGTLSGITVSCVLIRTVQVAAGSRRSISRTTASSSGSALSASLTSAHRTRPSLQVGPLLGRLDLLTQAGLDVRVLCHEVQQAADRPCCRRASSEQLTSAEPRQKSSRTRVQSCELTSSSERRWSSRSAMFALTSRSSMSGTLSSSASGGCFAIWAARSPIMRCRQLEPLVTTYH